MKRLTPFLPVIAVAGMLALSFGCASTMNSKQGFDFSQYHTFAILPLPEKGTYQDPAIVTRLGGPVRESIVDTLSTKGFKEAKESEADFLVKILFDYQPDQGRRELRMFDIQIIDRKTGEVVWSQYSQRLTDNTMPPEAARKRVADMLKPFPPGSH
jgi:hypothetical protein